MSTTSRIAAIVLAAGKSSRMGENKLLAEFHGQPLILATLLAIQRSAVDGIIAVLGHDPRAIDELTDLAPISKFVHNPDFAQGISTSIRCGVEAVGEVDAVVICLADMPMVKPQTIDKLISAFNPIEHRSIIVPTHEGQFGNPVLWGRAHFPHLLALKGDKGARTLLADLKSEVVEITVDDPGILLDADTPEALAELRAAKP